MSEPILVSLPIHVDDRGTVYCSMDNITKVKRTYIVQNWDIGLVRAWHGHKAGWTGIHVIKGSAKVIAKHMNEQNKIHTFTLSDRKPGLVWIPPGWYNGTMSLQEDTRMLIYSTHTFDEVKKDDYRLPVTVAEFSNLWSVKSR